MEMSSEKKQLPKPKRRWFQLRLRTMLVLVTLASGVFGWVGWELEQRRGEKVAIAWLEKLGGKVFFETRIDSGFKTNWWKKTKDTLFGENVTHISLNEAQVSDLSPLAGLSNLEWLYLGETEVSDLSPLAGLKKLNAIDLESTEVTDLSPLAGLSNLKWLALNNTPVSDLSPLAGLKDLESLVVYETKVSDLTPLAGMKNLEEIWLNDTQVSDLSLLAGLENLRRLSIEGTNVTEEQIEQLQLALPNCKISR